MQLFKFIEKIPFRRWFSRKPLVPLIRIYGVISPSGRPLQSSVSLATMISSIEQAFGMGGANAIAIAVNSPGGSPVQSALIHDHIRMLAAEKKLPVYVFCEDVAASGGYWIACAGDEIYADQSSIIGSIGVISAGFGFEELIEKLGIERRLHASGEKKSLLDPFQPEREVDIKRLRALQKEIHDSFKMHVKQRRGERLKASERKLFSGEFWTGKTGLDLGLIDGLGDARTILRQKYGDKVRIKPVAESSSWLRRRLGLSAKSGEWVSAMSSSAINSIEERAYWQRFGF